MSKFSRVVFSLALVSLAAGCAEQKGRQKEKKDDKKADKQTDEKAAKQE
jgi:hypothetical protein